MDAGEIEISVIANYELLETHLGAVVAKSRDAGTEAATRFGANFEKAAQKYAERTAEEIKSKLSKAIGFEALGRTITEGIKAGMSGNEDWSGEILKTIESIPILGTVTRLMRSSADAMLGVTRDTMEAAAIQAEQKVKRLQQKFLQDRRGSAESQESALSQSRTQAELADAKRSGDIRKAADKEAVLALRKLDSERAKEVATIEEQQKKELSMLTRDVQRAEAKERHQAELDAVLERYRVEYDQIVKNRQASFDMASENDRKLAEKKAEDERKVAEAAQSEIDDMIAFMEERSARAAEEIAAETQKSIDAMTKQADDLEEQRMAAAQEQGTAQTAFGAFRFSAYTDAEKKQNDQSILTEIRSIRREVGSLQTSGGPM